MSTAASTNAPGSTGEEDGSDIPGVVRIGHRRDTRHRRWVLAIVLVACAVPLLAAVIAVAVRGWTPVGEFAQAELRVRDFWAHPPSLGAVGRLRTPT
ncbi:MAG: hypothetical protein ACK5O2_14595, partial [Microthrixaceae bacterium]